MPQNLYLILNRISRVRSWGCELGEAVGRVQRQDADPARVDPPSGVHVRLLVGHLDEDVAGDAAQLADLPEDVSLSLSFSQTRFRRWGMIAGGGLGGVELHALAEGEVRRCSR